MTSTTIDMEAQSPVLELAHDLIANNWRLRSGVAIEIAAAIVRAETREDFTEMLRLLDEAAYSDGSAPISQRKGSLPCTH
jgi:hypothetical protein